MKKYIQVAIVLVLTLAVVGTAQYRFAWASPQQPAQNAKPLLDIDISENGSYTVGGLCIMNVEYKATNIKDHAAVDVPAEVSREVTFSYPDDLYLAGCHFTHYKDGKITNEVSSDDGSWEMCFGDRPDEKLTIYYYSDDLAAQGQATWLPLPTTKKGTYVCAPAMHTGVYAPGGVTIPNTGPTMSETARTITVTDKGTVRTMEASSALITEPGTYSAGGICELTVDYYVPNLGNELHVENNVEISANVPFPDNAGMLYQPGCHVYHYKAHTVVDQVTTDEGSWEICFATIPGKQTTIYFYYSDSDLKRTTSVWSPLDTTISGGKACASLTDFTGVYTPVGKDY